LPPPAGSRRVQIEKPSQEYGVISMVAAVRVHKTGGPEVLTYEDIPVPAPGPGQVKIKNHACGVNFIDTYFRMGMYPSPVGMPFVSGNEGAGEVIAVGPGVTEIKVGDRVGYVSALGAYAAERLLPADRAVKLPDSISYEQAAAMMLKGMTAQYLLRRTYKVQKGDNILIHAAAGGVGLRCGDGGLSGFDVDCSNPETSARLLQAFRDVLGPQIPIRWGREPRFLIPYFLVDAPVQGRTFSFPDGEKLQLMGGQ